MGPGHQLLVTTHGDLDWPGRGRRRQTYEDLWAAPPELSLGEGLSAHVLDLPTLIELKEQAGRPKDLAVCPSCVRPSAETLRR